MTSPVTNRHTPPLEHSSMPGTHRHLTAGPTSGIRRHRPTTRRTGSLSGTAELLHDNKYASAVTATEEGQTAGGEPC